MTGINININGEPYDINAENCAVFTFQDDKYNHLFIATGENEGMYIFGRPDILIKIAETQLFAMHFLPYVPQEDMRQYEAWAAKQPQEPENPMTEAEVDYYAKELEGRVNWDELK